MNERLLELAKQAGLKKEHGSDREYIGDFDWREFAELIVKSILDRLESEREYYANPGTYQFLEYYTKMSAKEDALRDAISMIRSDFGVLE